MTTYNKARDYLLIALSSVGNNDSMKAIAALRQAVMQKGCSSLVAELESLSRTEFELAAEEIARRQDNADGTDGNYPHMPDGYDHSKESDNNPEDIAKGNSLDNYPSVRVDFLMDGKTGADSGNYSGPEISSNKLSYPGVDGNGSEDFDSADNDTAVNDIGKDGLNKETADEKMHGHEDSESTPPPAEVATQDISEGTNVNNADQTGITEPDMSLTSGVLKADPDKVSKQEEITDDKVVSRADGTAGEGSNSQSFDYAKDGLENNGFDVNDFTAANVDLLEDLEDIDDEFPDEDDEILMSPDGDEWDAFILEDETANLTFDQFPVDMSDKESNDESDEGVPEVTIASEDMPAKIWDRGEEGCSTEEADSDSDGDLNNTEIDEQNAKALDAVFAHLDQVCADTDTSGQEDSLDVAPPVVGSVTHGQYWYQHASIQEASYHADECELHLAEAKQARKLYAAARIEGNKEAAEIHRAVMNKAERWYRLHHNQHQKLLQAAGERRAARIARNKARL